MKRFSLLTKIAMACGHLPAATALHAEPDANTKPATPREWWRGEQVFHATDLPNAQALPRLHVERNRFVTADGKPILLRGVSIADPDLLEFTGHWNQELFQ